MVWFMRFCVDEEEEEPGVEAIEGKFMLLILWRTFIGF
jgi:hypothetical protein